VITKRMLSALKSRIRAWAMPQEAAAAWLGITRPRLNDLLRGKLGVPAEHGAEPTK
jgi:predicted XRE-type DNA-binding protein